MNIRRKAFSIGTSAALLASLLVTSAAGTVLAASGALTCTAVSSATATSVSFPASGTASVTMGGTWQPGSVFLCTNSAVPAGTAGSWTGWAVAYSTTPATTAGATTAVLGGGPAGLDTVSQVAYIAADGARAEINFTMKYLSVALSPASSQLDGANVIATATNAIGNGAGGGDQTGVTYASSSGTPTAVGGGCTATPGAAATAALASAATSTVTRAAQGSCGADFTYGVAATTPGTLNFGTFTMAPASSNVVNWWDAQLSATPPAVSAYTDNLDTPSGAVSTGQTISASVTRGVGITGTWTATGATPASVVADTQTFTVTATSGAVTILWTSSASNTHSYSYTVAASVPACLPGDASTIAGGSTVACTFTAAAGATFVNWTTSGFTPATSASATQAFTASTTPGAATITANWTDSGGAHSQTFNYTISLTSVACSPSSGNIVVGGTVACTFTGAVDVTTNGWTASGFTPATAGAVASQTFTAGAATGPGSITSTWTDGSGPHSTTFSYAIVTAATGGGVTATHTLSVPRGNGYVDATGAALTFTEGVKTDFGTGFSFIINIAPATPGAGSVSFDTSKVISIVAPDSLALKAMFLNAQQIQVTSAPTVTGITNNAAIEVFSIGNLHVKAAAGTTLGGIITTITGSTGSIGSGYWGGSTTATGYLNANYASGVTSVSVTQTSTCPFLPTVGTNPGPLVFAATTSPTVQAAESVNITTPFSSIGATALPHASGALVSQTVPNCAPSGTIASIGSVVDALLLAASTTPGIQAGLNNQPAGNITITEQAFGFIPSGTSCTLSISEPGVLFSGAASVSGDGVSLLTTGSVANVGDPRTTLSFTTTAASTTGTGGVITVSGINYDVLATATLGDMVNVTVTCGALLIAPTSVANAFINNAITQTAAAPTVWIGYNDQASGMISIKESQTGFFGSLGGYLTFTLCINPADGATFTRAPWAVVAAGDTLKLLDPSTSLGVSSLKGTLLGATGSQPAFTCASWSIYSASTSTVGQIDLRGSDTSGAVLPSGANNGPRYNIAPSAIPGPVHVTLAGTSTTGSTNFASSVNAIKAFKSGVVVTALTQPYIAPGTTGAAGDLTIAETLNGQFVPGEEITCRIVASATNFNTQVYISNANSNDLPIISTNTSSGLIAHLTPFPASGFQPSFAIMVDQSAFAPNFGTITVTNLHYRVVSGAILGPVTLECSNFSSTSTSATGALVVPLVAAPSITGVQCALINVYSGTFYSGGSATFNGGSSNAETVSLGAPCGSPSAGQQAFDVVFVNPHIDGEFVDQWQGSAPLGAQFDAFVSNAIIGTAPAPAPAPATGGNAGALTALGVTHTGPFTVSTKLPKVTKYVTYKFDFGTSAAGKNVQIWVATKSGVVWSTWTVLTSRIANSAGTVYYSIRQNSKTWKSFRAMLGGTWSLARQARWI